MTEKKNVATIEKKMWIHPLIKERTGGEAQKGPFIKLENGTVMGYLVNKVNFSKDGLKTWSKSLTVYSGPAPGIPGGNPYLVRTENGVIVMVYIDSSSNSKFNWDSKTKELDHFSRNGIWSIRSFDNGKSWTDRQRIADVQCGALTDIIYTSGKTIICPATVFRYKPSTLIQRILISRDEGKSWKFFDIDIGGHGHHDGAMEPTLVEINDKSIMMYIRTGWGYFWEAVSKDDGDSWYVKGPVNINASSSPGAMKKTASGRIVIVWNQELPEGFSKEKWAKRPGAYRSGDYSRVPGSWHRQELSVAVSEDDGRSFSKPLVIAKITNEQGGWLCYPYLFEVEPGKIWIDTWYDHVFDGDKKLKVDGCRFELEEQGLLYASSFT